MSSFIMIHTNDGISNRYNKNIVKNFELFANEEDLENLMSNKIITLELTNRKINFISRNIVRIEVVDEREAV